LLKDRGDTEISVERLDKIMYNVGNEHFDYESFKMAYDSDARLKEIITDFNKDTITIKTSEVDDVKTSGVAPEDPAADVNRMAMNATNRRI
jgi:hypothetical protein